MRTLHLIYWTLILAVSNLYIFCYDTSDEYFFLGLVTTGARRAGIQCALPRDFNIVEGFGGKQSSVC